MKNYAPLCSIMSKVSRYYSTNNKGIPDPKKDNEGIKHAKRLAEGDPSKLFHFSLFFFKMFLNKYSFQSTFINFNDDEDESDWQSVMQKCLGARHLAMLPKIPDITMSDAGEPSGIFSSMEDPEIGRDMPNFSPPVHSPVILKTIIERLPTSPPPPPRPSQSPPPPPTPSQSPSPPPPRPSQSPSPPPPTPSQSPPPPTPSPQPLPRGDERPKRFLKGVRIARWRGQHPIYKPLENGCFEVSGVTHTTTPDIKERKLTKGKKERQVTKKEKRGKLSESFIGKSVSTRIKNADLLKSFENLQWKKSKGSDCIELASLFRDKTNGLASGFFRMKGVCEKPNQKTANYKTIYTLLKGSVAFRIADEPYMVLNEFESVTIPELTGYAIKNLSDDESVLYFNVYQH
uniref:Uncharacterized protein n=1 Tax=Tetranychus urticae TaxID=32264 RepID=T1L1N8_TETUR